MPSASWPLALASTKGVIPSGPLSLKSRRHLEESSPIPQSPTRREHQRREAAFGTVANVRAALDQDFRYGRMFLRHRPHQRALPPLIVLGAHVSFAGDSASPRRASRSRTPHQRRFAGGRGCVRIRACRQQLLDHRGIAVRASERKRRCAVIILGVHIGAGASKRSTLSRSPSAPPTAAPCAPSACGAFTSALSR